MQSGSIFKIYGWEKRLDGKFQADKTDINPNKKTDSVLYDRFMLLHLQLLLNIRARERHVMWLQSVNESLFTSLVLCWNISPLSPHSPSGPLCPP